MSVRFVDVADAFGGAGLVFQDISTQSVTATASAGLAFQPGERVFKSLTESARVSVIFQNESEFIPPWIEYAASQLVNVSFDQEPPPPPTITAISPAFGSQGTTISNLTVTGSNFDPSSTLLFGGTGITVNSYSARSANEIVATITIAPDAPTGARDVLVVNPDLQQATLAAGFEVVGVLPDLVVAEVAVSPTTVTPGQGMTVSGTLQNAGLGLTLSGFHWRVFLSSDPVWDAEDVALTLHRWLDGGLAPGTSTSFSVDVSIPASTPTGPMFILVLVDSAGAIPEANEDNNVTSAALSSVLPDLVVAEVTVSPTTVTPGQAITVSGTLQNAGLGLTLSGFYWRGFLSTDAVWDETDVALTDHSWWASGLGAGASTSFSVPLYIPTSTPTGTVFILVRVDSYGHIPEANEDNNVAGALLNGAALLFNISTGGTTFTQGAIVPFGALVYEAGAPGSPLTPTSVGVRVTVVDPASATVYGPTALSFDAVTGLFTGALSTSGLRAGSYSVTFAFSRPDGIVLGLRSVSFELVAGLSLSVNPNQPEFGRGQSVGLSGHVEDPSGVAVVGVAVSLTITLRGVTRQYTVFSDGQGNYEFVFTPPPTEAGNYAVTARALLGGASNEASTAFVVHGLMVDPTLTTTSMLMNSMAEVSLQVRNIGETNLTDVTLAVQDLDPDDGITGILDVTSLAELPPGASQNLSLAISAPGGTAPAVPVLFKVVATAAQGVVDSASVDVSFREGAGAPVIEPSMAIVGMTPGSSRLVSFTLRNESILPIADTSARVQDPESLNWVVIQNGALGTLAPGESKTFGALLLPPADLPLGSYVVQVEVITEVGTILVPVNVDVTASYVRPVSIQVGDDAATDVPDAAVQLVRMSSSANGEPAEQVYQGTTDASGRLELAQVAAGAYTLRVQAARHADYEADVTVEPGSAPQEIEVMLSTTVVAFSFNVTRTAIVDEYDVALVVTYSTDLIKPALVVSPARVDLSFFRNEQVRGTITVTNSHTQATVRDISLDATNLDLPTRDVVVSFDESGTPVLSIGDLGPRDSRTVAFTAIMRSATEPPSHPLGSIVVRGDYTYSYRGRALVGTTVSPVFVTYVRPTSLRMFPPIAFLNDETGAEPALTYLGATTRITLQNERSVPLDFVEFGPGATVAALQIPLPANVPRDQVPLEYLQVEALWTGALESSRLESRGSRTAFDITSLVGVVQENRAQVVSRPPYIAVAGRWSDGVPAQGFVFPVSITTIRPYEIQMVQSGGVGTGGTTILGGTAVPQSFNSHGIVHIQIDQKVSLEREAFTARLGIFPAVAELDGFSATLAIRNADGTDASENFVVIPNVPRSPITRATEATWLIVPKVAAGGTTAAGLTYTAAVHIVYSVRGVPATFDTSPESFTVLPLPRLRLDYTIPYVVMGGIPFEIRVDVTNVSDAGIANDVTIESAQPRIIDNINNVPVNFRIDGNLNVALGTIGPGQIRPSRAPGRCIRPCGGSSSISPPVCARGVRTGGFSIRSSKNQSDCIFSPRSGGQSVLRAVAWDHSTSR